MTPGTIIGDRFELEQIAGSGGMGVVFRARDRLNDTLVAVKILRDVDPILIERFDREATVLGQLRHPGIVRYIMHGATPNGGRYLAIEWLAGEDLAQRLGRQGLTPAESMTLLRKLTGALAVAHARGVVHRDIKPSNIFLVGGDVARVKLLDFGIAQLIEESMRLTRSDMLVGTPGYMAPEQAQGRSAADPRADVFSLGCVLFECIAGRPAFEGEHAMALLMKIVLQEVPPLRELRQDVPEPVERLVARMLEKDPQNRPRDAGEVAGEAEALEGTWGEQAAQVPPVSIRSASPAVLAHAVPTTRRAALTLSEQRVVSVVIADARRAPGARSSAPEIERCGGSLDVLADGSMVVTIWGSGSAVDRAERAARCALAMQRRFADVPICVVTGRGVVSAKVVEGKVIDRGVHAVRAMKGGAIRLDSVTASMLGPRFLTEPDERGRVLRGERPLRDTAALLLGKPTACVGRTLELSTLESMFSACVSEPQASAALMIGPAGAGKSRLRRELTERLRRRDRHVTILSGHADSIGESSPFGPIADAIRDAAGIREAEPIEARRQKLTRRLGRHLDGERLARVATFLGELTRAPFPDDDNAELRAARADAQLMGDAMQAAWEDWLTAECEAGPVALIIDDLHWADAATVQMIDATLRNLRHLPLMTLGLARPDINDRFPDLWASRGAQLMNLRPLSPRASEQLVRGALGRHADDDVVARIIERADGNAFYLEELVRAIAAGRGDALPDSVLGTVEARLDAESAEAKRTLRAASVFGARFSRRGVAALLGDDSASEEAGAWLSLLADHELIAEASAPDGADDKSYVFCHALVREAAYATLTEADRLLGHRLAGAWLEQIGHPDAMTLAEHFHRGEEPARAARWYRRGAEQALEANDLDAALERAERGVASGASSEDLGTLRLVQAEAHVWRGELARAEQRSVEALGLLAPGSAAWFHAVRQTVIAAGKLGGFERVERWVTPATAAVPTPDALNARTICLSECANYLIFGGRHAAADALIEALGRAGRAPSPGTQAIGLLHQMRAIRASAAGDLGTCLEGFRGALAAFMEAGDRRNTCTTLSNLGFIFAELGDFEGAEQALRAALVTADRMGLRDLSAAVCQNLGRTLARRGRFEEARRVERRAVKSFRDQGDPRLEGLARTYLAEVEILAGDPLAAEREARAAADAPRAMPQIRAGAMAVLARALLALGRVSEALLAAEDALASLEALGSIEEGEALIRLVYAEALLANGRERESFKAIIGARDHLLERAAMISDPAFRERFLRAVPENAQTLALAVGLPPRCPPGVKTFCGSTSEVRFAG